MALDLYSGPPFEGIFRLKIGPFSSPLHTKNRRKPLRGALFIENSSVSVHYLRDPPGSGRTAPHGARRIRPRAVGHFRWSTVGLYLPVSRTLLAAQVRACQPYASAGPQHWEAPLQLGQLQLWSDPHRPTGADVFATQTTGRHVVTQQFIQPSLH